VGGAEDAQAWPQALELPGIVEEVAAKAAARPFRGGPGEGHLMACQKLLKTWVVST
jgi:hypothetical protein